MAIGSIEQRSGGTDFNAVTALRAIEPTAIRSDDRVRTTPTGLGGYLKERGFKHLFLCGLATDYCVGFSALDARKLGFAVTVVEPACRAIDLEGSLADMRRRWAEAGVTVTGRQAA